MVQRFTYFTFSKKTTIISRINSKTLQKQSETTSATTNQGSMSEIRSRFVFLKHEQKLERWTEFSFKSQCIAGVECSESAEQLLLLKAIRQTCSMGTTDFHFVRTYHLL